MPSRVGWFIWLVALSLFGAGCSSASKSKSGQALATEGETEKGIDVLTQEQLEKRADAHAHFLMGLSHEQNQQITKALEEYELALAGDPKNETLAVDLSRRYIQRKDYDKAIAVLKTAARQQGASGVMYARLSLVYLQQGNTNAAVDASRTAIKRDPGSIADTKVCFTCIAPWAKRTRRVRLWSKLRNSRSLTQPLS